MNNLKSVSIVVLSFLLINSAAFSSRMPMVSAQQELNFAEAVVIVNSASESFQDFHRYIKPYLDHFGIPYSTLDISTAPISADVARYSLIVIGHNNLDPHHAYLDSAEEGYIREAVDQGAGLVNFDTVLAADMPPEVTINCWEDEHQDPVLTTLTDPSLLNLLDDRWDEFWWSKRDYPGVFGGTSETLPVMRFYATVPNGRYNIVANLYHSRDYRYYWGFQRNNTREEFFDLTYGEDFVECNLGTITITNEQFEIYVDHADLLSGQDYFFGWAWIKLFPQASSQTDRYQYVKDIFNFTYVSSIPADAIEISSGTGKATSSSILYNFVGTGMDTVRPNSVSYALDGRGVAEATSSSNVGSDSSDWSVYSSELLANPGAELGSTNGWIAVGPNAASFAAGYDCPFGSAGPHTGSYCFYWNGPSSSGDWAYQEVDLSPWLSKVQDGEAQILVKGWLICSEYHVPPWDTVRMKVVFYDGSNQEIGEATYDTGARGDLQAWTGFGVQDYPVPTNAVKLRVWFQTYEDGWDAGNADDFTLKIRTYEGAPTPTHILSVGSSPVTGVSFTLDGVSHATNYTAVLNEGDHTVAMPSTVTQGGTTYNFTNWEDGSTNPARTLSLIANMTITAYYEVAPPPEEGWTPYSSELLVNPGAEFGNTNGWVAMGPNSASFAAGYDAPRGTAGPHTGSNCFFWNRPSSSGDWAYQEVNLSPWLSKVQDGEAQILAKGWLICSEYHDPAWDIARMRIVFYDSSNREISGATYDTEDRGDLQVWTGFGVQDYAVPANAVKLRVWFQTYESNWDAGNADDFTLRIRTYEGAPTPTHILSVGSSPVTGVSFTLDGVSQVTPYWEALEEGNHGVIMPSTVTQGGTTYNFLKWEDETTSPTRTVSLTADTTITAYYEAAPGYWSPYSGELLVNPGAELGSTSGWVATGPNAAKFAVGYDCPSGHTGPHTGSSCFFWNRPSSSGDWAYQEVNLSPWLSKVQAGKAQVMARGWLVCSEYHVPPWDTVRMKVMFYDGSNLEIGGAIYDTGARGDLQAWTGFGVQDYPVPTNAVKLRVWFQTYEDGWDAGNADDFTLRIRTYRGLDDPPIHTLSVGSSPVTGVSFTLESMNSVTPFSTTLDEGNYTVTMPELTVVNETHYRFKSWEDGSTSPTRKMNLVSDMSINAYYEEITPPATYVLSVFSSPVTKILFTIDGTGYVTPWSGALTEGTHAISMPSSVTVAETAYGFVSWEDGSTSPTRTISLTVDMALTSYYEAVSPPPVSHFIIAAQPAGNVISLKSSINPLGVEASSGSEILATASSQPLLIVKNYGLGRAVQWTSYNWMKAVIKGYVYGLDDLIWRSFIWAARKPFVMQGMPPFLTMRVDDCSGGAPYQPNFGYVSIANKYGIKPWVGFFLDDIDSSEAQAMKSLVDSGGITVAVHARTYQIFFYFDHRGVHDLPDSTVAQNFRDADAFFEKYNISKSKFLVPHYYEIGTNVFTYLTDWNVEFVGVVIGVGRGYETSGASLMAGPYRLYETPSDDGGGNDPLFFADWLTIPNHPELDKKFFNLVTEIRDNAGYEWYPSNDVQGSIDRGSAQVKRAFDSMVVACLFTHEQEINGIGGGVTPENWDAILAGIMNNVASYNPICVTMDYAARYARAAYTSRVSRCTYDPSTGRLTITFSGEADIPTKFYLFTEEGGQIQGKLVDAPPFTGNVTITQ